MLSHLTPGGPAYSILGPAAKPELVRAINHEFGLDLPLWRQYGRWLWELAHGRLGSSYLTNRPVGELLLDYERNTIVLQGVALLASLMVALAAGMAHGVFHERRLGRVIGGAELLLYSAPTFFTGTLLILWLSMGLGWFPAGGLEDLRLAHQNWGAALSHLALPALTLTLFTVPTLSRYFASSVHEELGKEYVRSAAARGASPLRVLFRHVLRNALVPTITVITAQMGYALGGLVVVESLFRYQGIGSLVLGAARAKDFAMLQAGILTIGAFFVATTLAADFATALLDPRLRTGGRR